MESQRAVVAACFEPAAYSVLDSCSAVPSSGHLAAVGRTAVG